MNIARWKASITVGFAIFSMIFGSGNLIFPINAGRLVGDQVFGATLGILATSAIMPLIGLIGVMCAKGNSREYFSELPDSLYFILLAVLVLIIGPLYVIPRCAQVAFGGFQELYPSIPFEAFSLFFIASIGVLSLDPERVVGILGKCLSPFKFTGIAFITAAGMYCAPCVMGMEPQVGFADAFRIGAIEGYQTMDLVGAVLFCAPIYQYLSKTLQPGDGPSELLKRSILGSIIGEVIIGAVYICFVQLGSSYASLTGQLSPVNVFPFITKYALGDVALIALAFTFFFACLATALTLTNSFAIFLRKDVFKERISILTAVTLTSVASYVISLAGFMKLANFYGQILSWIYPVLILFALYKIFYKVLFCRSEKTV